MLAGEIPATKADLHDVMLLTPRNLFGATWQGGPRLSGDESPIKSIGDIE